MGRTRQKWLYPLKVTSTLWEKKLDRRLCKIHKTCPEKWEDIGAIVRKRCLRLETSREFASIKCFIDKTFSRQCNILPERAEGWMSKEKDPKTSAFGGIEGNLEKCPSAIDLWAASYWEVAPSWMSELSQGFIRVEKSHLRCVLLLLSFLTKRIHGHKIKEERALGLVSCVSREGHLFVVRDWLHHTVLGENWQLPSDLHVCSLHSTK